MLLEWPEHDKKLVEGLSNLHQLNAFHDVTLSAEGKQIKAHRVILASASTYFKVIIYLKEKAVGLCSNFNGLVMR